MMNVGSLKLGGIVRVMILQASKNWRQGTPGTKLGRYN